MPFSANSRNAAGTSIDGISKVGMPNLGISNFGISNLGAAKAGATDATGFFDFGAVAVVVGSAMTLILGIEGSIWRRSEPSPSQKTARTRDEPTTRDRLPGKLVKQLTTLFLHCNKNIAPHKMAKYVGPPAG